MFPHSRCNWVIPGKVLMGAEPIKETFPGLLKFGITTFINLLPGEAWYREELPREVSYYHYPCGSGRAPSRESIESICERIRESSKLVYLHCAGGHGRAGTVAAIIAGREFNLKTIAAINYIKEQRDLREDTSRNFVPLPETNAQVAQVVRLLDLEAGMKAPDRSDKSWLYKVKLSRKI